MSFLNIYESNHKEHDSVKEHSHDRFQILYVLEGSGVCGFQHERQLIKKDSLILIAPRQLHSIHAETKMTNLVLDFTELDLEENGRNILLPQAFSTSAVLNLNVYECNDFKQLLRKMLYEKRYGDELQSLIIQAHLMEILVLIIRTTDDQRKQSDTGLAERLKEYIDKRYFDIESAEDMASMMNVSKRYIQTIFKDRYDRTPMQYLTEIRIRVVKNLLLNTDKDIISICFEVGFESVSTFYRIFKNAVGMPPNAYRHQNDKIYQ